MSVMRRGREEKPVLEAIRKAPDGFGDLRIDSVLLTAGRSGVVRFIENQERSRAELVQPIPQPACVGFVDQQTMRDKETRMCRPWIHAETALASNVLYVLFV